MSNWYIRLRNGEPIDLPIEEDNLRMFFTNFDENNLPEWLAKVIRTPMRLPGVYEHYEGTFYEWDGDIIREIHRITPMTEMEKRVKQQETISNYINAKADPTWIFDEERCDFVPPIPYPTDGQRYIWDRSKAEWVLFTE